MFIDAGADICAQDWLRREPIHTSITKEVALVMIEHGASPHSTGKKNTEAIEPPWVRTAYDEWTCKRQKEALLYGIGWKPSDCKVDTQ